LEDNWRILVSAKVDKMKLPHDMESSLLRMIGESFDSVTPADVAKLYRDSAGRIRRTDDINEAQKILDDYEDGTMRDRPMQ
jgi:hypothetical protein